MNKWMKEEQMTTTKLYSVAVEMHWRIGNYLINFWARFIISVANAITFVILLWLLFFSEVKEASRDLVNILVGTYVAILVKITDYWFKDKRDQEHEEHMNGKS